VQILRTCNGINDPATSPKQVTTALDAINPEELTVAATTALRVTSMQNGNLMQRLDALRSGASGIDLAGLNLQIGSQRVAGAALTEIYKTTAEAVTGKPVGGGASADDWSPWGLFANGNVKVGQQDQTDNAAGFEYNSIGVTAGVDYRFAQNFVLGVGLGYTSVSSDYDHAAGNLDIDAWSASLFGTYFIKDSFYLDGMLTYGSNAYRTTRNIRYTDSLGTIDAKANGDTDGLQLSGGLSGGFDFNHGPWTFGPHFGADYTDAGADSFKETGAGGYDMAVGDQHAQSFQLNGGLHLSFVHNTKWGVLIPHVRVDYVHELQDSAEVVAVRLANDPFATDPLDPSPHVHLQGDRPDSDYVVWSVGASAQFINGVSGFVNYRSFAGFDDFTMNEFTFGVRMEKSF
jgi:outer membrane autotransporter protein